MSSSNYFELTGPKDLFREVQLALGEYTEKPSVRLFLFLAFALNHLREWIAGCGYNEIQQKLKANTPLTDSESFFVSLWDIAEFKLINSLCNRGKHFTASEHHPTSIISGFHVDGWCTDSLDQTYYMIDEVDSRDCFYAITRQYHLWFEQHG